MDKKAKVPRVVILTALLIERQSACAHLFGLKERSHPEGTIYWHGNFPCNGGTWDVNVVEIGQGNPRAAMETERAINFIKPDVTLFVGVAGGLKDVQIGDVVAATKVYGYQYGKADKTFKPRQEIESSTYRMRHRAQADSGSTAWLQRIKGPIPVPPPHVYVKPIAAGEQVVSSTRSSTYKFLREHCSDALAIEMEGLGFLSAIHANQFVNALVVRGISDLIDGKSEADDSNSQEIASRHASAFAFEILAKLSEDNGFQAIIKNPQKPGPKKGPTNNKYSAPNNRGQMAMGDNPQFTINLNHPLE